MANFKPLTDFLLKTVWPWIAKEVLPILKKFFLKILEAAIDKLTDFFMSSINKTSKKSEKYQDKAEEETKKAEEATNPDEKSHHEELAKIWRTVADDLREENEKLKLDLANYKSAVVTEASNEVNGIDIKPAEGIIMLGNRILPLPAPNENE